MLTFNMIRDRALELEHGKEQLSVAQMGECVHVILWILAHADLYDSISLIEDYRHYPEPRKT